MWSADSRREWGNEHSYQYDYSRLLRALAIDPNLGSLITPLEANCKPKRNKGSGPMPKGPIKSIAMRKSERGAHIGSLKWIYSFSPALDVEPAGREVLRVELRRVMFFAHGTEKASISC